MPIPITVPRLGWSMEEGLFGDWLKSPGELVRAGEMIFLLEGEKAATEIESLDSGRLCLPADAPRSGATVKVGEVIGFLLAEGEPAPTSVRIDGPAAAYLPSAASPSSVRRTSSPSPSPATVAGTPVGESTPPLFPHPLPSRAAGPAARRLARKLGIDLNAVFTPDPTGRVLCEDVRRAANRREQRQDVDSNVKRPIATPRARRRACELGIDWTRLQGSGRDGRIRERDVLAGAMAPSATPSPSHDVIPPTEPGRHLPASRLRRIIARRMAAGVHQAAPVTLVTKADAEALVAYRERLKTTAANGLVPGYNDILLYWTARLLRELPDLNACWNRDGIHVYDAVHIALAVDAREGLLAPVIRDADRLTLSEIADRTRRLIDAARTGRVHQHQVTGGTFTISNLGMYGVDAFTPILNLPQAAILGVGRIVEEPVVRNGRLAVGKTMTLSLTVDHRIVDGAPAARWLQRLCELLQSPVERQGD